MTWWDFLCEFIRSFHASNPPSFLRLRRIETQLSTSRITIDDFLLFTQQPLNRIWRHLMVFCLMVSPQLQQQLLALLPPLVHGKPRNRQMWRTWRKRRKGSYQCSRKAWRTCNFSCWSWCIHVSQYHLVLGRNRVSCKDRWSRSITKRTGVIQRSRKEAESSTKEVL